MKLPTVALIVACLINCMLLGWVMKGKQFDDDIREIKHLINEIKDGQKAERLRLDWYMEVIEKIDRSLAAKKVSDDLKLPEYPPVGFCFHCNGTGKVDSGNGNMGPATESCPVCRGKGRINQH